MKAISKERKKEIIASHKPFVKPDKEWIQELARLQFDFIGVDVTFKEYTKSFKQLSADNTFTKEQYNQYKVAVFMILQNDLGYSIPKCETEFGYFYVHYGLKIK